MSTNRRQASTIFGDVSLKFTSLTFYNVDKFWRRLNKINAVDIFSIDKFWRRINKTNVVDIFLRRQILATSLIKLTSSTFFASTNFGDTSKSCNVQFRQCPVACFIKVITAVIYGFPY
jgi:hypothetical protein